MQEKYFQTQTLLTGFTLLGFEEVQHQQRKN